MPKFKPMNFEFKEFPNTPSGFKEYCIASLNNSVQIYNYRLKNIIEEYSESNVHDFRVSSRRFIATLNMINHFYPSPYNKRIRKVAKKHLDVLSRLRDVQVMSISSIKMKIQFPIMFEFLNYLNQLEFELINSNKLYFLNIQFWEIEDDLFHLIRSMKYELNHLTPTFDDLKHYILQEYKLLLEQKNLVNIDETDTIHKLRIKNKKFRYLIETTQTIFRKAKKICKILSTQQNKMGSIQDASVSINEIRSFLANNPSLEEEFQSVIEYLLNYQKDLILNFDKSSVILSNLIYFDLNEDY